ncbi:helix-turn-helix transcriptional regulator [Aquibium sp. LZ166]|uniref:Helix-turn-helix transcriptional regulator n=1 Tax=Aquibium pacificus TaxID=3153579 RepID=A0ABV3SH61_9HYPH
MSFSHVDDVLVDRIYEASLIPEQWPQVLRDFARMAGAQEAALLAADSEGSKLIGSSPAVDEIAAKVFSYPAGIERTRRLVALRHPGFVTDRDVFTHEEILNEPMFADYLIPSGYGRGIATAICVPNGDTIVLHAEGNYHDGPFDSRTVQALDALRPHMARASLLSARLGIERARAAAEALAAVGLPAAVLGHGGRTLAANDLLVALMPHVVQDRSARMTLTDPSADALLRTAIEAVGRSSGLYAVRSIPIRATDEHPPVVIHLVPVRGAAHDVFAASSAVLLATPVVPKEVPGANVLQALFDLTPAEAKVAQAIGNGETTAGIAASNGASLNTVRNQLAAVLAKSGLHRQSDLVGLLRGVGLDPVFKPS